MELPTALSKASNWKSLSTNALQAKAYRNNKIETTISFLNLSKSPILTWPAESCWVFFISTNLSNPQNKEIMKVQIQVAKPIGKERLEFIIPFGRTPLSINPNTN